MSIECIDFFLVQQNPSGTKTLCEDPVGEDAANLSNGRTLQARTPPPCPTGGPGSRGRRHPACRPPTSPLHPPAPCTWIRRQNFEDKFSYGLEDKFSSIIPVPQGDRQQGAAGRIQCPKHSGRLIAKNAIVIL